MREILFRGKSLHTDEWVFGYFRKAVHPQQTDVVFLIYSQHTKEYIYPEYVYSETVSQSTGIKDKNGATIFEGDILYTPAKVPAVVKFGEYIDVNMSASCKCGHVGFYVSHTGECGDYYRNDLVYWAHNSAVIGNIYDNPGLIGQTEEKDND